MAVAINGRVLGGIVTRQPDILKPFYSYGTFIQNPDILLCLLLSSFLATALHGGLLSAKTRHLPVRCDDFLTPGVSH